METPAQFKLPFPVDLMPELILFQKCSALIFILNMGRWTKSTSEKFRLIRIIQNGCCYVYCIVCALKTGGVCMHSYTFFTVLYPVGVTGELLCLYAAQSYVASKKLWSLEMPNKLNVTFSYYYVLLFTMLLYIPCKFHTSVIMHSVLEH
jgi:hypothetical protein